ncbi:MAG TPA: hypothetical protein VNL77_09000 [Roseiflexaceae bacterium]|nr:hypothetical protein [Roseiflexaceae bacterium]
MIEDDIIAEAARIVEAGGRRGLALRLLGGVAVRLHAPSAAHHALARAYQDIDLAAPARQSGEVELLLGGLGYEPDRPFNLLNGDHRLLFYDRGRGRQVDVFVGRFEMCHRLPLEERLAVEPLTLPLAELLLTKLQIVQLNEKDVRDICALVLDHPLGEGDAETLNLPRITQLCADDWGLWKTATISIRKAQDFCEAYDLEARARLTIVERLGLLRVALAKAPKSLRWRMRAAVGERVQWYELPEEVRRG